ncbi:hypothetical protein A7X81_06315 [Campylobacter ornithocola]|uniref:Uncharacterized protein n=1 Tax=Campylobacter ornithocola TaxID=1848766 RepID=A0A6M8N300_9BACT|nr:ADP-ribosyltransferase [Campylobacter ornithocola]OCX42660.1 hypothetical protein A7X81_06315 [Campylobacter ornithocola]QKF57954.1 ADP-ribosyltransferase exoenzyme [Campylobacter ornithocola]
MKKIIFLLFVSLISFKTFSLAQDNLDFSFQDTPQEKYRKFSSGNEVVSWWQNLYSGLKLSKDEKNIIYQYTFGDFVVINGKLRNGFSISSLDEKQKDMISRLDKALSKTIVFENLQVYRYENLGFLLKLIDKDLFKKIYQNGKFTKKSASYLEIINHKKYKDYGFMSTTAIRNSVFQTRPIELVIKVPKYSDVMFVSLKELAGSPDQYELLFPRNRILTIEKYELSQDYTRLTIFAKMSPPCQEGKTCIEEKVDNLKQPKN